MVFPTMKLAWRRKLKKIEKCLKDYCNTSTIHGLRNIAADDLKWFERCFWLVVCLFSAFMAFLMLSRVWDRYQKSPTMTTIESTNHPISDVPFPAITLCNLNKILNSSALQMMDKLEAQGIDRGDAREFLREIPQIYTARVRLLKNEDKILEAIQNLGYDLESFMFEISQPCSRQLVRCMWMGEDRNCSEMFVDLKTPDGFCCSFHWRGPQFEGYPNLNIRSDFQPNDRYAEMFKKEIFVSQASTTSSGLTVVFNSEENEYFASVDSFFGSTVLLHTPLQYPDLYVPRASVQPRFETVLRLRASIMESSPNVRSLKIHQRQCYYADEVSLNYQESYSYDGCAWECKFKVYQEVCGCVPFFFPNETNIRTCNLTDMRCVYKHKAKISKQVSINAAADWDGQDVGSNCRCLPLCDDFNYDWIAQGNKIYSQEYASPIFLGDLRSKSVFHVYFEDRVCTKYRTESSTTWDNVVASLGGIFGLCLGGSIVSLIEIIYYFAYEYWRKDRAEMRSQEKSSKDNGKNAALFQRIDPVIFHLGKTYYSNKVDASGWIK